jgi:hypothetical protein
MTDPMTNIEDEKGQVDIGIMLHRIFRGAQEDGASWITAYLVTAAFAHALFKSSQEEEGGE